MAQPLGDGWHHVVRLDVLGAVYQLDNFLWQLNSVSDVSAIVEVDMPAPGRAFGYFMVLQWPQSLGIQ